MLNVDDLDLLIKLIKRETLYDKIYSGEVIDTIDPEGRGRIQVSSLDFGFTTQENGYWCEPRGMSSNKTPKLNAWVDFYFVNGDMDRPAYFALTHEMDGVTPKSYKTPDTHVIFENPNDSEVNVVYDAASKTMKLNADKFDFNKGSLTLEDC